MSYCKMSYRKFTLGLLATAVSASFAFSPARAADLDYGYGAEPGQVIPEEKVEFGSGWYIRGDIGATRGLTPRTADDPYHGIFLGPGRTPPTIRSDGSQSFAYDASIGGGYQVNRWFRTDIVFDFHQPKQNAYQGRPRDCITGTAPDGAGGEVYYTAQCTPTLKADLKSYDVLVNGYLDLGTWSIVTPYVGAGIGLSFGTARASSNYIMNNGVAYDIDYTDASNGATYHQNWDRTANVQYYNFAYALMAGLAFDVFDHTKLDVGYRFVGLGKVLGTQLNRQEVRAGLRYMIDN